MPTVSTVEKIDVGGVDLPQRRENGCEVAAVAAGCGRAAC